MRILTPILLGLLLLAAGDRALADAGAGAVAGALTTIEARVSQWPLPTAQRARDPVADVDGSIYFAAAGADKIVRFDPRSGQFREWTLPVGTKPHGMVVTRDGKVFFAANGNGTLGELDMATGTVRAHATSSPESRPYSVALDAYGRVWMTERAAGRLAMLDRATGKFSEFRMDGDPYALAFDQRGMLWVSRMAADKLNSVDPRTGRSTELFLGAGSKPRRIGVAPDGMLWVTLYGTGKLVKVDPATNRVVKEYAMPGGANAGPYAVNVDGRGRVWVVEFQTNTVAIFEPESEKFRTIKLPDTNAGARHATIDKLGRFWYVSATAGKLGVIE